MEIKELVYGTSNYEINYMADQLGVHKCKLQRIANPESVKGLNNRLNPVRTIYVIGHELPMWLYQEGTLQGFVFAEFNLRNLPPHVIKEVK